MSRTYAKWICALMAASAMGWTARGQQPVVVEPGEELIPVQAPATPAPRPAQGTPGSPASPPPRITSPATPRPGVRTPATTGSGFNLGLASAGTAARPVELPTMYGDFGGLFGFSPYTVATLPGGQRVTLLPGQLARLPAGTTFNRNINGFAVQTSNPIVPLPDVPLPPGFREKLGQRETVVSTRLTSGSTSATDILVQGQDPQSHAGGLPVNALRGSFKIGENESPRPTDRVYVAYNYFNDVNPTLRVPGLAVTSVHRQTFGIEKTFLDGDASIGLRLPLLQLTGPSDLDRGTVGDMSVILKFAWINNPLDIAADGSLIDGEVLSTGMVITVPTGGAAAFSAQQPEIHPTVIQPFVGGIATFGRTYAQFFSSLAVPTDDRDTTFFFNSVQLGYMLYYNPDARFVRSVMPLIELHVNTPLNNRGLYKVPIGQSDIVGFTGGATIGLGSRSFLNIGANVPVTGPRPYAMEAMAHLNVLY
jgi:hypothetical protein